jgi:hypothetical protein
LPKKLFAVKLFAKKTFDLKLPKWSFGCKMDTYQELVVVALRSQPQDCAAEQVELKIGTDVIIQTISAKKCRS